MKSNSAGRWSELADLLGQEEGDSFAGSRPVRGPVAGTQVLLRRDIGVDKAWQSGGSGHEGEAEDTVGGCVLFRGIAWPQWYPRP